MAVAIPALWRELGSKIDRRLLELNEEVNGQGLVLPLGIFLVLDEANGGNTTASEVVRRFSLLDRESKNWMDFYYLGWFRQQGELVFDLAEFMECRDRLESLGVTGFGGNADLILIDASISSAGETFVDFQSAMRIDLAKEESGGHIRPLGGFLQAIVQAAKEVQQEHTDQAVFRISDSLGLLYAKESLLDYVLDKWGKFFGARRLKSLVTRNLGPRLPLEALT